MTHFVNGSPGLGYVRKWGSRAQKAAWYEVQRQMEVTVNKGSLAIPSFQHHSEPAGWNLAVWNGWRD